VDYTLRRTCNVGMILEDINEFEDDTKEKEVVKLGLSKFIDYVVRILLDLEATSRRTLDPSAASSQEAKY